MSQRDDLDREIERYLGRATFGQQDGFTGLYRCLAPRVAGYARSRGVRDVDDVVNEIFLAAFASLSGSDWTAPRFRSWLFSIAWNKTADWHRRAGRQVDTTDAPPRDDATPGGDVEADALELLSSDRVEQLLDALTDDQRDVILLRIVADLSLEETATALDKPVGAVKALQHRALAALRRSLDADESPGTSGAAVSPPAPPATTEVR